MGDEKKLEDKLISFDNWVTDLVDLVPASVYVRKLFDNLSRRARLFQQPLMMLEK